MESLFEDPMDELLAPEEGARLPLAGNIGRKRSKVWCFFEKIDKDSAKCNICNKPVKGIKNTSNMMAHLERSSFVGKDNAEQHKTAFEECRQSLAVGKRKSLNDDDNPGCASSGSSRPPKQLKIDMFTPPAISRNRVHELDRLISLYILLGMHPVSSTETDHGLRIFLALAFDGSYNPPSRRRIMKDIKIIHQSIRSVIQELLTKTSSVAITTDIWTSPANKGFIGVTAHFVLEDKRYQVLLCCKRFEGEHTGTRIADLVVAALKEYSICHKTHAVVTDAARNMVKGARDIEKELTTSGTSPEVEEVVDVPGAELSIPSGPPNAEESTEFLEVEIVISDDDGDAGAGEDDNIQLELEIHAELPPAETTFSKIQCAAHQLQLAVKAALKTSFFSKLLADCRKLVGHIRHSSKANDLLREQLKARGLRLETLQQENPTRWNSTYVMLQRLVDARDAIETTARSLGFDTLQPRQYLQIHYLLKMLKPFAVATKTLAGELPDEPFQSGLSSLHPAVYVLKKQIARLQNELPDHACQQFLRILNVQLDERFGSLPSFYAAATLLDPRFKKGLLSPGDFQASLDYVGRLTRSSNTTSSAPTSSQHSFDRDDIWSLCDEGLLAAESGAALDQEQWSRELDLYLKESILPRKEDPLIWWGKRKAAYPILGEVAPSLVCTPTTSAPVERVYSYGRLVMNHLRTRLGDDNLETCIFARLNMDILKNNVLTERQRVILKKLKWI